jgi:universal stress protein A
VKREHLTSEGIDAHYLIRSGEPDDEILDEIDSGDYDMVAMATHGHSFFGDLLFGSVSRTLKHKINIPLLLIKADHSKKDEKQG